MQVLRDRTRAWPSPQHQFGVAQPQFVESFDQIMEALPWLEQTNKADAELCFGKCRSEELFKINWRRNGHHALWIETTFQKTLTGKIRHHTNYVSLPIFTQDSRPA